LGRTAPEPRHIAQGFVDHLNGVLNRTVSRSRLSLVPDRKVDHPRFDIVRYVGGATAPLELHRSPLLLLSQQKIDVEAGRCLTVTYQYRLQRTEEPQSWLVRWEFFRQRPRPDYVYPLAHVHVNAVLRDGQDVHALDFLHFPTRRVPFELVLWHLIVEWGVTPLSDDWQAILSESIDGFEERQTVR
jgi:hypothetical protein